MCRTPIELSDSRRKSSRTAHMCPVVLHSPRLASTFQECHWQIDLDTHTTFFCCKNKRFSRQKHHIKRAFCSPNPARLTPYTIQAQPPALTRATPFHPDNEPSQGNVFLQICDLPGSGNLSDSGVSFHTVHIFSWKYFFYIISNRSYI